MTRSERALPYIGGENIESQSGRILLGASPDGGLPLGISNTFRFDSRHVLYSKLRPYLNKVALPDFSGRCSTELIPLLPVGIDRTFLAIFLRLPETVSYAMREATGSRMPRTDMESLMGLPIPLPPLYEQERIVCVLNEQMATVERAKKAAEERLEAAQALQEAELRKVWPALEVPLPAGWKWARLGDVCSVVTGSTPTKSNPRFYGGDVPWINPSHLGSSKYVRDSDEYLTGEGVQSARLVLKGAVLVTCISGSLSNIGKVSIAERSLTTNQQINSVVAGPSIEWEYLYYHILAIKPELEALAASTNQNIVNKSKLSNVTLAVPPLETQGRVSAALSEKFETASSVEKYARDCLESLGNLSSSILQRAFSGKL